MRLLDVLGTNSETFSLGMGEKKVEIRTINGVLHFRNFGTGWERASSESLREALQLRSWTPGLLIGSRELFIYNNSIWYSINTITASNLFSNDSSNFVKISDTTNFEKINISVSSTILNSETSDYIYFQGESSGEFSSVTLPDATQLVVGRQLIFINSTLTPIRVYKHNSTTYFTITSTSSLGLVLTSKSTSSGDWSPLNFSGAGGSGGLYQIDVSLDLSNYNNINPFKIGDFAYYDINDKFWKLAYSDNFNLNSLGVVTFFSGKNIRVSFFGIIDFSEEVKTYDNQPLIPGTEYYLSDISNPGKITSSKGTINKKIFIALSSNSIFLLNQEEIERFNEKKIYSLNPGSSENLNEGFSYSLDGFIQDDPNLTTFSGYIYNSIPTEALIESSSDIVFDSDSPGGICFFMDGNNLKMKNNLESSRKIVIYRKKIK